MNVGSVRLDADPEDVPAGVRLADTQALAPADVEAIKAFLLANGDPVARKRRELKEQRIAARLKMEFIAHKAGDSKGDLMEQAAEYLAAAGSELPRLADDCRGKGGDPWDLLRGRYLRVYRAWKAFEKAAQVAGAARTPRKRTGGEIEPELS